MDCLERSKENCCADYHKNYGIINNVSFGTWIVKRREQSHKETRVSLEFKNSLPILEICDQINDLSILPFNTVHVSTLAFKKYLNENGMLFV